MGRLPSGNFLRNVRHDELQLHHMLLESECKYLNTVETNIFTGTQAESQPSRKIDYLFVFNVKHKRHFDGRR